MNTSEETKKDLDTASAIEAKRKALAAGHFIWTQERLNKFADPCLNSAIQAQVADRYGRRLNALIQGDQVFTGIPESISSREIHIPLHPTHHQPLSNQEGPEALIPNTLRRPLQQQPSPSTTTMQRQSLNIKIQSADQEPEVHTELTIPITKKISPAQRKAESMTPPCIREPFNLRDHWARDIDPNSQMLQTFLRQNGIWLPAFDDERALRRVTKELSNKKRQAERDVSYVESMCRDNEICAEEKLAHHKAYIKALEERIKETPGVTINTKKLKALRESL